ncbi:MAG: response regulator [Acidobacteriia bacterium]|nr:response regulator [Terriglobia bacterium]
METKMHAFQAIPIKRKLTLIILVISFIALLLASGVVAVYDFIAFRRAMVSDLLALAQIVADNSTAALTFNDQQAASGTLASLKSKPHIISACLLTPDGKVFASYVREDAKGSFSPPSYEKDGFHFSKHVLVLFHQVVLDREAIGTVYLQSDLQELSARLKRYGSVVLLVLLGSTLLVLVLSNRLQRVISDPILQLAQTARLVSMEKNYSVRAVKSTRDELGMLIDAFNDMLRQIQLRDAALQSAHNELEKRVEERTRELHQDIIQRKRAENELYRSQQMLQLILDNIPQRVFWKDKNLSYLGSNKAFLKDSGFETVESIVGKSDFDMGWSVSAEAHRVDDRQVMLSNTAKINFEEPLKLADGSSFWLRTSKIPLRDRDGQVIGVLGTCEDITEQKRLEDQLRQAQKMEAVGRLAGGVAHDFNNLLTAISGYSELLLMKLDKSDPLRRNAEEIRKAGERAASLTRQLLAFSRRQVVQPEVLDLNHVIADMEKMLHRLIGEDIDLVFVAGKDLERVKADPGQMHQVIMNLSVNSRDAMPHGGKLILETHNVELDEHFVQKYAAAKPGPYVMLAVTDSGSGMTAEVQSHLFEPFYTTKEVGKGTGLGLSTVYGIVEQNEGFITVYSEMGHGTTIKVYLPCAAEEVQDQKAALGQREVLGGSETVLLVEDEEGVRALAREILTMGGYKVLEAADGEAAIQMFDARKDSIGLVITDLVMPKMSGHELAQHISSLRPEVKILFVSGYTPEAIARKGILDPETMFLQKPFTPKSLARKVREVLDRQYV